MHSKISMRGDLFYNLGILCWDLSVKSSNFASKHFCKGNERRNRNH